MVFPLNVDCAEKSLVVYQKSKNLAVTVRCGSCGLSKDVLINSHSGLNEICRFFLDIYHLDEYLKSIAQDVKNLNRMDNWEELISYYTSLRDMCRTYSAKALKNEGHINLTLVHRLQHKANECNRKLESLGANKLMRFKIRKRDERRGYFTPYPYVFKPPEPPDGIGVATNVQLNQPVTEEELNLELFCRYCGSELSMDERFCSVCGKKS